MPKPSVLGVATAVTAAAVAVVVVRLRRRQRQQSTPRLTYFDFAGFGDRIRLTLAISGIEFEDERLSPGPDGYAEVARRRDAGVLPFGQVPVLTLNGSTYAQTNAILRYFGRQAVPTLYPEGIEQLRCDMILDAFADLDARLMPLHYAAAMPRSPTTGKAQVPLSAEQMKEVTHQLISDVIPTMLQRIEKLLQEEVTGPWFCGPRFTICDVVSYSVVSGLCNSTYAKGLDRSVVDCCPSLLRHAAEVGQLPAVKRWQRMQKVAAATS